MENEITLVAVVHGGPEGFVMSEEKIRERLADYGFDIVGAARSLCYEAPQECYWTLDKDSVEIVREIGLAMIEEMKGRLG